MEKIKSEKDIYNALQGYWEPDNGSPGFLVKGRKLIVNGAVSGIGIPGIDNLTGTPLLLKWNDELSLWQIFSEPLGWFLVFLVDVTELSFMVREYDPEQASFMDIVTCSRK
jgi:hypothetical protein